jgi:Peptidase M16 inactive domain
MHSRLFSRVLNQYSWVHSCTAFSSLYNDEGLFGIFITPDSSKVAEAVAVACNELQVTFPACHPYFSFFPIVPPPAMRQQNPACHPYFFLLFPRLR